MNTNKRKLVSFLFLTSFIVWIISVSFTGFYVSNNVSNLQKVDDFCIREDLFLETEPGIKIGATIFYPKILNDSNPAVIIQHGLGGRRENMMGFALTFVNRGFVAVTCDLRGHGQSTGANTFGAKESDDLIYVMNWLKTNITGSSIGGKTVIISEIGLLGHSLGALTVTLASYKSGVNSCVALAPPAIIGKLLDEMDKPDFKTLNNLLTTQMVISQEWIDSINLHNWSAESPAPKNYLAITSDLDTTVPPNGVYNYFKELVQIDNPEQFTTYGSFSNQTALQFNNYTGKDHNDQQYVQLNGNITKDSILWTEKALGISNSDEVEIPEIAKTFHDNYDNRPKINLPFTISVFMVLIMAWCILYIWFAAPPKIDGMEEQDLQGVQNIPKKPIKPGFEAFIKSKSFSTTFIIAFVLLVFSGLFRKNFSSFVQIMTLGPFLAFLSPIAIATLLNRNIKIEPERFPMIFVSVLLGTGVAFYICEIHGWITNMARLESWFYGFELPQVQILGIILFVLCFNISYFVISEAWEISMEGTCPVKRGLLKIVVFILIYGVLATVLFALSPYNQILIHGIPFWVGLVAVVIAMIVLIEIPNLFFSPVAKNSMFSSTLITIVLGWILVNAFVLL